MKRIWNCFNSWCISQPNAVMACWAAAFIFDGVMAFFDPLTALGMYVTLLIAITLTVSCHAKGLLTILLIGSLLYAPLAQAVPPQPRPAVATECVGIVLAGIVVVVGGIVVYKTIQFCKKHLPPPPPPPGTPCPTNGVPTNAPAMFHAAVPDFPNNPNLVSADISTQGWMDNTVSNNPVPFQDYIQLTLLSSTDLSTWRTNSVIGLYLSENSMEAVSSDGNGQPVLTNWFPGNPYLLKSTNAIPLPLIDPAQANMFFKWQ